MQLRQLLVKSFIFPVEKRKSRGQRHRKILQKNFLSEIRKNLLQIDNKRCIIYKWLWKPDTSLDGQGFSARFADFVPQEMKYVALIAACPSEGRH